MRTRTATTQQPSRFLQVHAKVVVMAATSTWTWRVMHVSELCRALAGGLEFAFSVGALLC